MSLINKTFLGMLALIIVAGSFAIPGMCAEGTEKYTDGKHSFVPASGFVPNEETAIKIAWAILLPIYGKETLEKEEPLIAEHQFFSAGPAGGPLTSGEKWYVHESLPVGWKGGVAEIEVDKNNGQILRVSHGK